MVSASPGPLTEPPALNAAPQPDAARFLECDALVQCDDPKIRAFAAVIVRSERDPWARALLIEDWVYRNIRKRTVLSLPSAADVLARREGDCSQHTVLFTALARAAGVPTRMAAGLVWSEEEQAFAYHAWPEVFVGRWVWTDPTFGQPVADATHLKLATGDVADWQGDRRLPRPHPARGAGGRMIRTDRLRKRVRRHHRRRRPHPERRGGRVLLLPGAQRRRQDDHDQASHRVAATDRQGARSSAASTSSPGRSRRSASSATSPTNPSCTRS